MKIVHAYIGDIIAINMEIISKCKLLINRNNMDSITFKRNTNAIVSKQKNDAINVTS